MSKKKKRNSRYKESYINPNPKIHVCMIQLVKYISWTSFRKY
jgi:hypothetical protein